MASTSIAFDIGGTFTDFVLRDVRGRLHFLKLPTTPDDPARAVIEGVAALLDRVGVGASDVSELLHATTVATNAIIERKGARTALVATRGFRDVLIIGRQKRHETYDLHLDKPAPLVPRRHIHEVTERLLPGGGVLQALDPASVERVVRTLARGRFASVAVCLMHAYANPAHERALGRALARALPGVEISLSSDVSPKFREYERTSTTVANAYVKPIVERYLANLEQAFRTRRLAASLYIMQSNGGLVSAGLARAFPVRIVESGPAAGVLMANVIGRAEGCRRLLTFDMGGTTAKLGAIDDGEPAITATYEVDAVEYRRGSGLPLNVPSVELLEIGAGGGSIASVDMGLIHVGPRSAGAVPGPLCYGRGGELPTVTDANLLLGYIDPDNFNGGAMRLDIDRARAGIARHVAKPLRLSDAEAAWGIHAVANSNMERAMRTVSVERGRDPREHVLVAFGGAGPLHAARIARALAIPRFIVPGGAGVGSAIGLLEADLKVDAAMTRPLLLDERAGKAIAALYGKLETRVQRDLARLGVRSRQTMTRFAYMRYRGQGFEIKVDLPAGAIGPRFVARAVAAFHAAYARHYGYQDESTPIEAIDWYLVAAVSRQRRSGTATVAPRAAGVDRREGSRRAYFPEAGGFVDCRLVSRYALRAGQAVRGPAIVTEDETSVVLLPGDVGRLTRRGNLMVTVGG